MSPPQAQKCAPEEEQDKNNKEKSRVLPTRQKSIDELLKAVNKKRVQRNDEFTHDGPEVSMLSTYIGYEMRSPVPSGQQNKLARTFTESTTTGQNVHASPDDLWNRKEPGFRDFVERTVGFWRKANGTDAQKRNKAINQVCNYNHTYGWFKASGRGPNQVVKGGQWRDV